jgi:hypothetical protein
MHELGGQERMENGAQKNDRSHQVERFDPDPTYQFLEQTWRLVIVIFFE